jgi:nitrous oxide reductase accessory protein NosL
MWPSDNKNLGSAGGHDTLQDGKGRIWMPADEIILRFRAFPFMIVLMLAVLLAGVVPAAAQDCGVSHPLDPPDPSFTGRCPNCGMTRAMWARTWVSFENPEGRFEVCSLHCLADISRKSGNVPRQVRTALYLTPEASVPAEEAFFVVGSRAPGTMTGVSKLSFPDRSAAEGFAAACGGRVTTWLEAYSTALAGLSMENPAIAEMRLRKGKITEPRDRVDECVVCGMYPARYDRHRAQVKTPSGETRHFCSTQCLFKYLKDPRRYEGADDAPRMIWVSGTDSGDWISAWTAYFVVGSKMMGPMGYEALAFDTRAQAEAFIAKSGGRLLPFSQVRIEAILSNP